MHDPVAAEVPAEDYMSTDAVRPKAKARVTPQARVTQKVKAKGRPLAKGKVKAKTDLFEDAVEFAGVDESLPTDFGVEGNGDEEVGSAVVVANRAIHKVST